MFAVFPISNCMSNWNRINACRVSTGHFASTPEDGFNGAFLIWAGGTLCKVFASDGAGWQHVSVSLEEHPGTCPKWDVMCYIKSLFWEPEDCVVQFHPAESDYVNNHPGCLHMWRCTDGREFPTPPSIMVGYKELNQSTKP